MKESVLLVLIGVVGITGLINIHQEEKAEKELNMALRTPGFWAIDPGIVYEQDFMGGIFQVDRMGGSLIRFKVESLAADDQFCLEFGNGEICIIDNIFAKMYTKPGIHLIKLFRNGDLIAVRNLEITCHDLQQSTL